MTFGSTFGRTFSPTFHPKSQANAEGGWLPTDLSGLVGWYDFSDADTLFTDAGSTKVVNDGDAIYRVNDKSGNNYHANQATASKRPLYKTNILNGKSVGLANSANAQELLTGSITLGDDIGTVGLTVFSVAYVLTSAQRIMFQACNCRFGVAAGNIYNYARIEVRSGHNTFSYNNWYAFSYTVNDTAVNQYLNGVLKKSADTGTLAKTYTGALFSSVHANYFDGYIAEIVCYLGVLSDTDRLAVETYLNNKWAIY